ncbi:ABC-type molybdate transport system substrate-binding protein [Sphingomonas sp. BE138]|uniref:hypothetical protein n=1 Tax=Sphingomonas sp. BE138 TaxID=2817845 RepID=UPI00285453A6|nr:hypothetical protein [Sphingomonas sp. BE138]MDR6787254.1 ABC-type molybdate transport system substrate-binding protein [Sphingomonas sp. BE138]
MTVVILMLLAVVAAGLVAVRFTRARPVTAAAAIGVVGAAAMIVAMLASVSARFEAVAITFVGTFVGVAALALIGAMIGAVLRPRRRAAA